MKKVTFILYVLGFVLCGVVIGGIIGYNAANLVNEPKTQNGFNIVNNCDTIYQVINIEKPNVVFSTKNKNLSNWGGSVSVGYEYSKLFQRKSLNYGLNIRYKMLTFGGFYSPDFDAYGVKVGYTFEKK